MNLNKYDKEAFVNAVINDIPQVDYAEQIRKLTVDAAISHLPAVLVDAMKDPEVAEHIDKSYVYFGNMGMHVPGSNMYTALNQDKDFMEKMKPLEDAREAQAAQIEAMRASIAGMINGCKTLKQAKERLPEFEKYLPAERDGTGVGNLPVANVVADLTKMGWPKNEQKAA